MKRRLFYKNAILLGNLAAGLVGYLIVETLTRVMVPADVLGNKPMVDVMTVVYTNSAFALLIVTTLIYERPIRRCLNLLTRGQPVEPEHLARIKRRLLNEPYVLIGLDFFFWSLAAVIFGVAVEVEVGLPGAWVGEVIRNLVTGMLTVTLAFFWMEHMLQKHLAPVFFPEGGLWGTPRVLRIRIGTRLAALVMAASIVPLLAVLLTVRGATGIVTRGYASADLVMERLQIVIAVEITIFVAMALALALLVTTNLTRSLREIVSVLGQIGRGAFNRRVRVTTNDEIGYTGDSINRMSVGLAERDFIKEAFGKYVTKEIRDEILAGRIPLDGVIREVTVMFADLRDFTPLVEATPPREVVRILNGYFEEMTEAINRAGGVVLQFLGDEIYAVFGAPLDLEGHARQAMAAALDMRRRLTEVNDSLAQQGFGPLRHGIGLHTGQVLAANIGSPDRLSYLLVGDTVNVAARLQGLNKDLGTDIILSRETQRRLNGHFQLKPLAPARVKGKAEPIEIYTPADPAAGNDDRPAGG